MFKIKLCVIFVWVIWVGGACASRGPAAEGTRPTVILVSIDGYRHDYTEKFRPPHLLALLERGAASAEGLKPIYPSKTFPNHYAIATGLTADHHGIVANEFRDPELNISYSMKDAVTVKDGRWYGGVPLWNLAERNGVFAACYFWPGSEAEIGGLRPSISVPYDIKTPNSARVNQVLQWLQLPEYRRPHFITLYFSTVDTAGHKDGPDSQGMKAAVLEVDQMLGQLQNGLDQQSVPANVIVVSDHGMQPIDQKKVEYVDDFADLDDFEIIGDGTHALLYLKEGRNKQKIRTTLQKLNRKPHHFKAYARQETPAAWHYRDNKRIGDIVLEGLAPYYMQMRKQPFKLPLGNHGYDPDKTPNMVGVFYAWGPEIAKGARVPVTSNVEVYPLIASILKLKNVPPTDTTGSLLKILKASP